MNHSGYNIRADKQRKINKFNNYYKHTKFQNSESEAAKIVGKRPAYFGTSLQAKENNNDDNESDRAGNADIK